jgi:hypothetical protein
MFIALAVVAVLLALAAIGSGLGKLSKHPKAIEPLEQVGVSASSAPALGALEVAGGLGVLVGLYWAPLGIAAATGLALYFVGAVITHLRAGDRAIQPAVALLVLSIGVVVLRVATL